MPRKPVSQLPGAGRGGTKPRGTSKAASQADLAERRARIFEMRRHHATFAQIATQTGLNVATVHGDYHRYIAELVPVEEVEDQRRIELERLDALSMPWYRLAIQGDEKAAVVYLRARDQYAKISGMYAPIKVEVRSPDDIARDLTAYLAGVDAARDSARAAETDTA